MLKSRAFGENLNYMNLSEGQKNAVECQLIYEWQGGVNPIYEAI